MEVKSTFLNNDISQNVKSKTGDSKEPAAAEQYEQITELRAYHTPNINFRGRCSEFKPLPEELRKAMDDIEADFELSSGYYGLKKEPFRGTIKEYIEACFEGEAKKEYKSEILHATSKESAKSILASGFDINKCIRDMGGPGVYFTNDVVYAKQVGGGEEILSADFNGTTRSINRGYYSGLESSKDLENQLKKVIEKSGLNINVPEALQKYTLDVLRNDYELDALYSNSFVVLNTDCISRIARSDASDLRISGSGYDAFIVEPPKPQKPASNGGSYDNSGGSRSQGPKDNRPDDIKYWNY